DQVWLIPLVPAVSFFAILSVGKRLPRRGSEIGTLAVASSFVMACITAVQWIARHHEPGKLREPIDHSVNWWKASGAHGGHIEVGIHVDGLTVMMLFVVTTISLLVHVYSTEYMHGDRRFTHYYAFLSL